MMMHDECGGGEKTNEEHTRNEGNKSDQGDPRLRVVGAGLAKRAARHVHHQRGDADQRLQHGGHSAVGAADEAVDGHDAQPVQRQHRLLVLAAVAVRRAQLAGQHRRQIRQPRRACGADARGGGESGRHGQQQRGSEQVERRLPRTALERRRTEHDARAVDVDAVQCSSSNVVASSVENASTATFSAATW